MARIGKTVLLALLTAACVFCGGCFPGGLRRQTPRTLPPPASSRQLDAPESEEAVSSEEASSSTSEPEDAASSQPVSEWAPVTLEEYYADMQADWGTPRPHPGGEKLSGYLLRTVEASGLQNPLFLSEGEVYYRDLGDDWKHGLFVRKIGQEDGMARYWGVDCLSGEVYRWELNQPQFLFGAPDGIPERVDSPAVITDAVAALDLVREQWNPGQYTIPYGELTLQESTRDGYPYYASETLPLFEEGSARFIIDVSSAKPGFFLIHSYEIISNEPEESHTATTGWYTVYRNGFIAEELTGDVWIWDGGMLI